MRPLLILIIVLLQIPAKGQFNRRNHVRDSLMKASNPAVVTPTTVSVTPVVEVAAQLTNDKGEKIQPAEFPGGMEKFNAYIVKKTKYPEEAKTIGMTGKVLVQFVVGADGKVKPASVHVVQRLIDPCDREAVKIIKGSPKWTPGKNLVTGAAIESTFTVPVEFKNEQ